MIDFQKTQVFLYYFFHDFFFFSIFNNLFNKNKKNKYPICFEL